MALADVTATFALQVQAREEHFNPRPTVPYSERQRVSINPTKSHRTQESRQAAKMRPYMTNFQPQVPIVLVSPSS